MRKLWLRQDDWAKNTQLGLTPEPVFLQGPMEGASDFRVEGECACGSERLSVGSQDRGGQQRRMRRRLLGNPSWGLSGWEQVGPFGEGSGSWKHVLSWMRSVFQALTPLDCDC